MSSSFSVGVNPLLVPMESISAKYYIKSPANEFSYLRIRLQNAIGFKPSQCLGSRKVLTDDFSLICYLLATVVVRQLEQPTASVYQVYTYDISMVNNNFH